MNLRGLVIPLLDLRRQFGWPSIPEELERFSLFQQFTTLVREQAWN